MSYFKVGSVFPPVEHRKRIEKYRRNKAIFLGKHFDVLTNIQGKREQNLLYISMNLAGLICKKSADFLFGEHVRVLSGNSNKKNQEALDNIINSNALGITNYESALANAYRGDSFYKIRWGQEYGGLLPADLDPFRAIIEQQDAEYVFPEVSPYDAKRIVAYHIATPVAPETKGGKWTLKVETHIAGQIMYHDYIIAPNATDRYGEPLDFKIVATTGESTMVATGMPKPLVVHVPNFSTGDTWEGVDDISELVPLFDELNNRLTQVASILDKHSDPALVVPAGTMGEDEFGNPVFNIAHNKVFEIDGQDDAYPKYITWNGQIYESFQEMEKIIDMIFAISEIPSVVLGMGDAGTSGSSGLAIKFMMNSLLAKVNRKRQYYDKAIKEVLNIAQLLEVTLGDKKYKMATPVLMFQDGLPKDYMEDANVMATRTNGAQTMSVKTALMTFEGLTEEQADAEIERIKKEKEENTPPALLQANSVNDTSEETEEPNSDPEVETEDKEEDKENVTAEEEKN